MIVVIGSPSVLPGDPGQRATATGRPADVARGAIDAGSSVQLVGKVGDDPPGDALLLALADAGIGHVAVLRDPARATPLSPPLDVAGTLEAESMLAEDDAFDTTDQASPGGPPIGNGPLPTIDAGDLELALRYLPDHRIVVVAEPLDPAALAAVIGDCSYVGAQLIVILEANGSAAGLPPAATAFEAPRADPDGIFARTVGRFAAALDQGVPGPAALAQATAGAGWQATPTA
ncbi:MAG: hypothetical protein ACRDGI_07220 [Candidatus Limnocylindrales bacterium]